MAFTKLLVTADLVQLWVMTVVAIYYYKHFTKKNSLKHNVNEKIFELVPPHKILKTGQMIMVRDLDRQVKFNKYKNKGYIEVFDGEYRRECYVDSIIFGGVFYI